MNMDRRSVMGLGLAAGAGLAAAAPAMATTGTTGGLEIEGDGAGRYAAALEDIRAYAAQHMTVYGLPGLTLAIVGPEGLTAFMRFGHADLAQRTAIGPDHLFQVGSISKSFTALAVFKQMQAGKFSLDADMRDLLPGVPLPSDGPTTVQSLLSHGSGLPDDAPIFPRGGDGRLWRGFAPGTQWSYSNLGFMLLSTLVERVAGQPFHTALKHEVLDPLGMTATKPAILTADRALYAEGHSPFYGDRAFPRAGPLGPAPWVDMVEGSGCVASTARDMTRYMRFLIQAGSGHGAPLLSDANGLRFCKPTIDAPGWAVKGAKYANGLAVVPVDGRPLLHHTGGMLSFNSAIHVDPTAGVGAFASTNVGLIPYRPRDLTAYACARLRAVIEGRASPAPTPAPARTPDAADYLGRYVSRDGQVLEISASDRGVTAMTNNRVVKMEQADEDAFIALDPSQAAHPLVFRRAAKAVVRAWWGETEYVRTRDGAPAAAFTAPASPRLAALTGRYVSDDPWRGSFQVTAQGDALFVDGTTPLIPRPDGSFRAGEKDWSPERMAFEAPLDGRPRRAVASGVDYLRRPT